MDALKTVEVAVPGNFYNIHIQNGLLGTCGPLLRPFTEGRQVFIITDSNVAPLYAKTLASQVENAHIIEVPAGENSKSIATLTEVYNRILGLSITRSDVIIALGGGVIGDLAGFVSSTVLRGVAYIQIPTTLLAQVDSSVGGKTAVNLEAGKNLVGTFYQPKLVLIDPLVLKTLNQRELACGMAEIIKYGCIKDAPLFEQLETLPVDKVWEEIGSVIETCCRIKAAVVIADEKDHGERMLLNFGHTLGHCIERYFGYGKLSHGAAVAIGMCLITTYAEEKGYTPKGTAARIMAVNRKYDLPASTEVSEAMLAPLSHDKKNFGGTLRTVMLDAIGQGKLVSISIEQLKELSI